MTHRKLSSLVVIKLLKYVNTYGKEIIYKYWTLKSKALFFFLDIDGLIMAVHRMPKAMIIPTLKYYGAQIGESTVIEQGLTLHNSHPQAPFKNLIVGKGVFIGRNVFLDLNGKIIIEDHSALGAGCMIWTHVGDYTEKLYNGDYHEKKGSVVIQRNTICYSGVIINQGINIGPYSRIGAGSVVIRNIPERVFAAGNPAVVIKELKSKSD